MVERVPKGPYTVWTNRGYEGWSFDDFETLAGAVNSEKWGHPWVIQGPVSWLIVEPQIDLMSTASGWALPPPTIELREDGRTWLNYHFGP